MQVIFDWLGSFPSWGADNTSRSELYSVGCPFIGMHSSNVSCAYCFVSFSLYIVDNSGSTVQVCMLKYFVLLTSSHKFVVQFVSLLVV
jgi:hypothetical protein